MVRLCGVVAAAFLPAFLLPALASGDLKNLDGEHAALEALEDSGATPEAP